VLDRLGQRGISGANAHDNSTKLAALLDTNPESGNVVGSGAASASVVMHAS
jgi:hypothetical protein